MLSILGQAPVATSARVVQIGVLTRRNFSPLQRVSIPSLQFNSCGRIGFNEKYGIIGARTSKGSLVLAFSNGKDNVAPSRFTPGVVKGSGGKGLLFKCTGLPCISCGPTLLSYQHPICQRNQGRIRLRVRGFKLSMSKRVAIRVGRTKTKVNHRAIGPLRPCRGTDLAFAPRGKG